MEWVTLEALQREPDEGADEREAEQEESDLGLAAPFEIEEQEGESSQPVIELRKPRRRRPATARVLALEAMEQDEREDRIDTLDEEEEELSVSEVELIEEASPASVPSDVSPKEIDAVLEDLAELREQDEQAEGDAAPKTSLAKETTASRLAAISLEEGRGAIPVRREPTLEIDEQDLLEEEDDEEEPADGLALDRVSTDEGLDDPTIDAAPAARPTMPPLPPTDEGER